MMNLTVDANCPAPHIRICLCKDHDTWHGQHTPYVPILSRLHKNLTSEVVTAQTWYDQKFGVCFRQAGHICLLTDPIYPKLHYAEDPTQATLPHVAQNRTAMTQSSISCKVNMATEPHLKLSGQWLVPSGTLWCSIGTSFGYQQVGVCIAVLCNPSPDEPDRQSQPAVQLKGPSQSRKDRWAQQVVRHISFQKCSLAKFDRYHATPRR